MQAAEPFVPEPSISEVEVAMGKVKSLQVLIRFQMKWFKQGGKYYIQRSRNLLS
jgi:hypothetical protein